MPTPDTGLRQRIAPTEKDRAALAHFLCPEKTMLTIQNGTEAIEVDPGLSVAKLNAMTGKSLRLVCKGLARHIEHREPHHPVLPECIDTPARNVKTVQDWRNTARIEAWKERKAGLRPALLQLLRA